MSLIITFVLWGTVGFLVGILGYLVGPPLAAQPLGRDKRTKISNWYIGHAMSSLRRGGIIDREHAGMDVRRTKWDAARYGERFTIDGEDKHVRDQGNMMRRLSGKPFAILSETHDAVVDPFHLHLAESWDDVIPHDIWEAEIETEDGDVQNVQLGRPYFDLDGGARLVDTDFIDTLQPGAADPDTNSHAYENGKKSQEKYRNNLALRDVGILASAYAISAGAAWGVGYLGPPTTSAAEGAGIGLWIVSAAGVLPL